MSTTRDWLPAGREQQLEMVDDWILVCTAKQTYGDTARTALETAKNETTRTPVATAQCKEAFDALTAFMRDFKRRYFLSPPLLDSDYISLGLKPHDPTSTPSGVPTAQVTVETYLGGRHELGVRIIYVVGAATDPTNKGYRIWYRVVAPGETPPANLLTICTNSSIPNGKRT
ncbi:MAG: hypothetical protein LBD44_00650 [Spirochaetaceae bacterium]|nr:hypothetical protein [Spirochaetaceae bacterium]